MSQLSIRNISKSFGTTPILRDINLQVEPGTILTLLGPSGCGKTTLLRIIAGLEQADTGFIGVGDNTFVDTDKGVLLPPQQRRLGFVFQDYGLWPHMTVAGNVGFPLKMSKLPKSEIDQRVKETLKAVRLSDHADKLPEQLSGGQKQRVSIARALAAKPTLILLDEPLSNLDANLREELGQEIRQLSQQFGQTCVNVTHDRREAQLLSDRIALMKDGICHQHGDPEALFRTPVDCWAARFLDAGNILPGTAIAANNSSTSQILVPRSAISLAQANEGVTATVISSLFIDDRYEVVANIQGHLIKMFANRPVAAGEQITLNFDQDALLALPEAS